MAKSLKVASNPPLALAVRLSGLSAKRREIIRPVLEHPRDFVLLTVRSLADRVSTDPATLVRIVQGMRFASYHEFQRYLHELSIAHATSLDAVQEGLRGSTIADQIRLTLQQDMKNLNALAHSLDAQRIRALVRKLYASHKILLIGGDLAAGLVQYVEHHLLMIGLPATSATASGPMVHRVRFLGKKDLVIAISFGRGLRQTVEGLIQARSKGAYCVGITDTFVSPVAHLADESYLASVDSPSFGSSYVAPVALFNAIFVACANYKRNRTLGLMKKVEEEQRKGFRWYQPGP